MRATLAAIPVALLAAALTAGCTGNCFDFPALADLQFVHEGSNATLIDGFRELGWTVTWEPGVSSLSFGIEQAHEGTRYKGVVHPSGLDRAGDVRATIEGELKGETAPARSEEHLAPVVEPIAARFGATPTYGGGGRHCGSV